VTGTNLDTKVDYTGTTNAEGYYSIPYVLPGTYDVTIDTPGFRKVVTRGVIATVNLAVRTDATLTVCCCKVRLSNVLQSRNVRSSRAVGMCEITYL